jgi:phosphate:Na+ symporter
LLARARGIELSINDMRTRMRNEHVNRLNDGSCAVPQGLVFIDMVTSFEKIGDHSMNVAEMLSGLR